MIQYFIVVNGQQAGPYTIEEVRSMTLTPDTLVWHAGMDNWAQANTLPELEDLFIGASVAPEQVPATTGDPEADECPKQHLGLAIFSAIMFPTGIAAIVKTVLIKTRWNQGRYDDARWLAATARKYSIMSIVIGAIFLAIYLTYYLFIIAVMLS